MAQDTVDEVTLNAATRGRSTAHERAPIIAPYEAARRRQRMHRRFAPRLREPVDVVHLCIPDDQRHHLPEHQAIAQTMPVGASRPVAGDVVYLTSTSAWVVRMVIHELLPEGRVRVEVWLEWVGSARHVRPAGFTVTQ